jgi:hypothetical protein
MKVEAESVIRFIEHELEDFMREEAEKQFLTKEDEIYIKAVVEWSDRLAYWWNELHEEEEVNNKLNPTQQLQVLNTEDIIDCDNCD